MRDTAQVSRIARFEKFEVNLTTGELSKAGVRIKVQDQPFQILAALLENPGRLVTREALQARLWPGETFVDFEKGLNIAVGKLRQALGDSSSQPQYIETLPRRGYRFIGAVELMDEAGEILGLPPGFAAERTVSHYRLLEKLGEGGMGVVYKAEDVKLRRHVALKFLAAHLTHDPEARQRFLREAQAAAAVDHPAVCTVYEIDEAGGQTFIAMAYVAGQSLEKKIEAGPLEIDEALEIAMQVAKGLQAAHERGVIHRDIKSANVMVGPRGQVKIMDFGLAQLLDRSRLTRSGTRLGTPSCMAPEQVRRKPTDHRTDIWSLGAVIYEMVTGRVPFAGEREEAVLHAIVHEGAKPLTALRTDVPIDLDRLVAKAMAKGPDERYQHAEEMLVDLRLLLNRTREPKARLPLPPPLQSSALRQTAPWVLLLVVGVLALALWLRPVEVARSPGLVRFSFTPDEDVRDAVISPNGRYIAYIAGNDVLQIWIRDLQNDRPYPLPGTEGVVNTDPLAPGPLFWSPGSDYVGFAANGELKIGPLDGGMPRSVCPLPGQRYRGGAWTPNGETIVFGEGIPASLFSVPAIGGSPAVLLEANADLSVVSPHFVAATAPQPTLLFENRSGKEEEASVFHLGSRVQTRLGISSPVGGAVYSPEGYILGRSKQPSQTEGLWAWPVSTDSLIPAGDPFLVAEGGTRPSLSRNGTLVYLDRPSRPWQLAWHDRRGQRVGPIGQPQPRIYWMKLSPDGRRFAGMALEKQNDDIWLQHVDRPVKTRFTFDDEWDCCPVWSPSGDRLTFVTTFGADWRMFSKLADGSGSISSLPSLGAWAYPQQWSASGEYLLFIRLENSQFDLWYLKHSGDNTYDEVVYLNGPSDEAAPRLSPNDRLVAYSSNESGQYEVYVQRFPEGGGKIKVSQQGGGQPRWSRDGSELFYVEDDWLVVAPVSWLPDLSFGPRKKLFRSLTLRDHGPAEPTAYYDVDLDSKRFSIPEPLEGATRPTIRVVQNWYEEFRDRGGD